FPTRRSSYLKLIVLLHTYKYEYKSNRPLLSLILSEYSYMILSFSWKNNKKRTAFHVITCKYCSNVKIYIKNLLFYLCYSIFYLLLLYHLKLSSPHLEIQYKV